VVDTRAASSARASPTTATPSGNGAASASRPASDVTSCASCRSRIGSWSAVKTTSWRGAHRRAPALDRPAQARDGSARDGQDSLPPCGCRIHDSLNARREVEIDFDTRSAAWHRPGAVFYDGSRVLGGCWIVEGAAARH
jgi:hypothetical protein